MNTNTIIGIIVVIFLAIVSVWWITSSQSAAQNPDDQMATTTATSTTSGTGKTTGTTKGTTTFKSIFTQSGSYECDYEQVGGTGRASNRIYIADGKMRGEFRTITSQGSTATLMVYNGGYLYTWTEGMTTGVKAKISSLADLPQAIPTDLTSGAIYGSTNNSIGWDCHSWNTDKTLLTVPSYVKFM